MANPLIGSGGPRKKSNSGPRSKSDKTETPPKSPPKANKSPRPKPIPKTLEPGPWHEFLAALGLKSIEALAKKHGVELDLGETKKVEQYVSAAGESGPEPIELASRVIAHILRRIPGSRKISERFEGEDKRSGILSDIGVLGYSILLRNEDVVFEAGEGAVSNFFAKKDKQEPNQAQNGHVDYVDLGELTPMVIHNNHEQEQ